LVVTSQNGIRKEIETIEYGTGGGITGTEPELTKQRIKKYNSKNELFYTSQKEIHRNGCLVSTELWEISTTDSAGITREFSLRDNVAVIKIKDSENKVIEHKTQEFSKFIKPDWIDDDTKE